MSEDTERLWCVTATAYVEDADEAKVEAFSDALQYWLAQSDVGFSTIVSARAAGPPSGNVVCTIEEWNALHAELAAARAKIAALEARE